MKKNILIILLMGCLWQAGISAGYADNPLLTMPRWDRTNGPTMVFSPQEIALYWKPITNNGGLAGYYIYRCQGTNCALPSEPIFNVPDPAQAFYADGTVNAGEIYNYAIAAYDKAGHISALSTVESATTIGDSLKANT